MWGGGCWVHLSPELMKDGCTDGAPVDPNVTELREWLCCPAGVNPQEPET